MGHSLLSCSQFQVWIDSVLGLFDLLSRLCARQCVCVELGGMGAAARAQPCNPVGFGLIALALVLALVYGFLCSSPAADASSKSGDNCDLRTIAGGMLVFMAFCRRDAWPQFLSWKPSQIVGGYFWQRMVRFVGR